jgi:hypothetical protein
VLGVVLTLAASGDDINVCRLAFPSLFAQTPVGSLPLDDDNFDFVESTEAAVVHRTIEHGHILALEHTYAICPSQLILSASVFHFSLSLCEQTLGSESLVPLRC